MRGVFGVILAISVAVCPAMAEDSGLADMAKPQYTETGNLVLPTGYRTWIYAGSSLGLSYFGEGKALEESVFHHIYIQPEAYRHYVETGEFPEKTMLVMENYSAGSKEDSTAAPLMDGKEFKVLHGRFEDARVGLEVALKDSDQFEDGWAYFNFSMPGKLKTDARAFPKAVCFDCHREHGADDNVFVQFYPVLREPLEKRHEK